MGKVRVVFEDAEPFRDRLQAGKLLAAELGEYRGKDVVILGIPRGGVVIARELAKALSSDFDIVLSRKIGAPGNPELALGAVSEDGKTFINEMVSRKLVDEDYVKEEKARQITELSRRVKMYRKFKPRSLLAGKDVIITDDGLATGATMQAAIWTARHEKPKRIVVAVPVAPPDTLARLAGDADEIIALKAPEFFGAVGQFYSQFDQVSDEEVMSILKTCYNINQGLQ